MLTLKNDQEEKPVRLNIKAELKLNIVGGLEEPKVNGNFLKDKPHSSHFEQDQPKTFIWKKIINRQDIQYDEMVLGTFEAFTANPYMIQSFFGRLYFSEDLKLMAKVIIIHFKS